ncbi:FAD-dependent oxidoreductase [Thalassospira xiamenensis]|uniref:FAD-dependent oxidoreductase n=1 Tax=Thalassospira xiamenensis TaxID=220697 RepID=UPI00269D6463|nr:FAD-dependent oxidoreductase [Thalassospira xiamenensis]
MKIESDHYDVLVAGGGQAGLIAAIVAAEKGARVCLLEGAPRTHRGGNTEYPPYPQFATHAYWPLVGFKRHL